MAAIARRSPRRIVITGANGNLGRKIIPALLRLETVEAIVGLDPRMPEDRIDPRVESRETDLTRPISQWSDALAGADTIIHLAATNTSPDSGWDHAFAAFDMTARLALYSVANGVERMIFASSNHAMGGHFHMEGPSPEPGSLKGDLLPWPGTKWSGGGREVHSIIYGSSKGYGERMMAMAAEASEGRLTTISIRIGWVQMGENRRETISSDGMPVPRGEEPSNDDTPAARWFKGMWMSNRDLEQLLCRAVEADTVSWPSASIVVNGVSNNPQMGWSLDEGERYIGYVPLD
jgi:nucleoside-diphosphate-sugar epimerase